MPRQRYIVALKYSFILWTSSSVSGFSSTVDLACPYGEMLILSSSSVVLSRLEAMMGVQLDGYNCDIAKKLLGNQCSDVIDVWAFEDGPGFFN